MSRLAAIAAAILLTFPPAALADSGRVEPGTWWRAWNADPLVLLSLGVLAWLYGRGLTRLWAKVGAGNKVRPWQAAGYFGALAVIFLALLSPLDALSGELSSAHVVQHVLLTGAAAPLFVVGSPTFVIAWGLPLVTPGSRSSFLTFAVRLPQEPILWRPLFTWTLFAGTMWVWHHPALYQAALRDPLIHDAQHLSLFAAACLYWRPCLEPFGGRRLSAPGTVPYLFTTSLHAAVLGVFLALSPRVWYGDYESRTGAWGLTPLEDQQLAGLVMWMPACLIYPAVAAALFGAWLGGAAPKTNTAGERTWIR